MNNATLCGNLGSNWEIIKGEYGVIAKNSIAISKKYTNKQGEIISRTQWIPLVAFNKQGEILAQYSQKGDKLLVRGEIHIDNYENTKGETRTSVSVKIEEFNLLGSRKEQVQEKPLKETQKTATAELSDMAINEQEQMQNSDTIPF